jgi:hypothetical protein
LDKSTQPSETVNSPEFSWTLFASQQVVAPLLSLAATGLLAAAFVDVTPERTSAWHIAGTIAGVITYISPGLFGFMFGALARSLGSAVKEAGRWIWVIPVSIFAVGLLVTLLSDWRQALPGLFGVRGGENEEGLGAIFITFPTLACCSYAVGISLRKSTGAQSGL